MLGSNMSGANGFDGVAAAGRFFATRSPSVQALQLAGVIAAGLLIRVAFIQSAGYADDLTIFRDWFRSIAVLPPSQVYAQTPGLNYPPMCVLLYEVEALVLRAFVSGTPGNHVLNVAIKLPPVLVDGLGAALVYRPSDNRMSPMMPTYAVEW